MELVKNNNKLDSVKQARVKNIKRNTKNQNKYPKTLNINLSL